MVNVGIACAWHIVYRVYHTCKCTAKASDRLQSWLQGSPAALGDGVTGLEEAGSGLTVLDFAAGWVLAPLRGVPDLPVRCRFAPLLGWLLPGWLPGVAATTSSAARSTDAALVACVGVASGPLRCSV